ncbi:MAG: hypothetical protein VB080_03970 [Propionicimonas sp.]|uniref:hypothetical protein n=1 Tax=Propionicimonas sp. TaxID=1955623 RepID=UPI002B21CF87|nr:hypothetical protein [Propionicimonas sp.]MEA4943576.1 hypothetical protein [Propionicimonas sp.]MEA5116415.1 hypothetical protein [Propionicimonas sp.]
MTSPDLGPILEALAAGRIDAAEAARRIDALKNADSPATPEPAGEPPQPPTPEPTNEELGEEAGRRQYSPYAREVFSQPPRDAEEPPASHRRAAGSKGVDRIAIRAVGRRVRIVGDAGVATASAEGPHVLRRNGSVLEVSSDGEIGPNFDGFSILHPPRSLDDIRALGLGKELFLRVNPNIQLDVEVTAGSLSSADVPYFGKVRLTAGNAELRGIREADDVLVQAGSATISGSISTGRSRVRVESGQLTIELDDNSDVTIHGEAQLGRIAWSGSQSALDELVLGNGSARLDLGVVMGWANVKAGPQ